MSDEKEITDEIISEADESDAALFDGRANPEDENADVTLLSERLRQSDEKYMRTLAEFDNFRKRTIKEKSAMYDDGVRGAVEKLLPAIDNLERAAAAAGTDDPLRQGVAMIVKQINGCLSELGVKEIEALGAAFDPNFHFAVAKDESGQSPENTVVEVLQKGYAHKDKVIRCSMVKVSS
ncbi:MAG: nucleotide exchange factor GrpE [Clostridiales bacterium]|jgi:molecular chaperone GrpE|nr:nucleotide exchange factor GrpE [Clostridiales bacterium]